MARYCAISLCFTIEQKAKAIGLRRAINKKFSLSIPNNRIINKMISKSLSQVTIDKKEDT